MTEQIRIGTVLRGYCGGYFGRDSYEDKRVEAIGADWVVARDDNGHVVFAGPVSPERLLRLADSPTEPQDA